MRRMVTFRSNRECRDIAVNPDQVLWVCHYENNACTLHFGKECFVRVHGDIADVVRRLEGQAERPVEHSAVATEDAHTADLH